MHQFTDHEGRPRNSFPLGGGEDYIPLELIPRYSIHCVFSLPNHFPSSKSAAAHSRTGNDWMPYNYLSAEALSVKHYVHSSKEFFRIT